MHFYKFCCRFSRYLLLIEPDSRCIYSCILVHTSKASCLVSGSISSGRSCADASSPLRKMIRILKLYIRSEYSMELFHSVSDSEFKFI
jgi:hypothetical protein